MDSLDRGRPCGQPSVLHGAASRGRRRTGGTPMAGAVGSTTCSTGPLALEIAWVFENLEHKSATDFELEDVPRWAAIFTGHVP